MPLVAPAWPAGLLSVPLTVSDSLLSPLPTSLVAPGVLSGLPFVPLIMSEPLTEPLAVPLCLPLIAAGATGCTDYTRAPCSADCARVAVTVIVCTVCGAKATLRATVRAADGARVSGGPVPDFRPLLVAGSIIFVSSCWPKCFVNGAHCQILHASSSSQNFHVLQNLFQ